MYLHTQPLLWLTATLPAYAFGAAHGLGTARVFQVDGLAGTFAGIAVGLSGIATALIVPLLARLS